MRNVDISFAGGSEAFPGRFFRWRQHRQAESEIGRRSAEAFKYDREILVEQFIKGSEVQVGILEDKALGAIEIVPKNEFYDFEAKYSPGMAEHILPARFRPLFTRRFSGWGRGRIGLGLQWLQPGRFSRHGGGSLLYP